MILRFRLLGWEIFTVELDRGLQDVEEEETEPAGMAGGSGHNFERDMYPPNPSGEEPWTDRFGFH